MHNVVSHLVPQDPDPLKHIQNSGLPSATPGGAVNSSAGSVNGQDTAGYRSEISGPTVTDIRHSHIPASSEINRSQAGLLDRSPRQGSTRSAETFAAAYNAPTSGSTGASGPSKPVETSLTGGSSGPADSGVAVNSLSVAAGSQSPWHLSTSSSSSLHPPCGSPWRGSSSPSVGKKNSQIAGHIGPGLQPRY
jgi:hypothetical protein